MVGGARGVRGARVMFRAAAELRPGPGHAITLHRRAVERIVLGEIPKCRHARAPLVYALERRRILPSYVPEMIPDCRLIRRFRWSIAVGRLNVNTPVIHLIP